MKRLFLALLICLAATGIPTAQAEPGGPFMLQAHDGSIVRDDSFRGRFLLIYFGYTFCPDICPTSLTTVAQTMDLLGEDAEAVQPLFITVDPERDTVEVMRDYVAAFHPTIIGLTGPVEFVEATMRKYGVRAEKVPLEDSGTYLMDHTSTIFLMGPDGRFIERVPHVTPPEEIAAKLRQYIAARK